MPAAGSFIELQDRSYGSVAVTPGHLPPAVHAHSPPPACHTISAVNRRFGKPPRFQSGLAWHALSGLDPSPSRAIPPREASSSMSILSAALTQDDLGVDDSEPEEWCPTDGGGAAASNIDPASEHVSETRLGPGSWNSPPASQRTRAAAAAAGADDPQEASSPELSDEQVKFSSPLRLLSMLDMYWPEMLGRITPSERLLVGLHPFLKRASAFPHMCGAGCRGGSSSWCWTARTSSSRATPAQASSLFARLRVAALELPSWVCRSLTSGSPHREVVPAEPHH